MDPTLSSKMPTTPPDQPDPEPSRADRLSDQLYRLRARAVDLRRRGLAWLGHTVLQPATRFCLYHGGSQWCWICGGAAGMGPYWGGAMTCWDCADKWQKYHRRSEGLIVDWRGLGRLTPEAAREAREKLLHQLDSVARTGRMDLADAYAGHRINELARRGLIRRDDEGAWVTWRGRLALKRWRLRQRRAS